MPKHIYTEKRSGIIGFAIFAMIHMIAIQSDSIGFCLKIQRVVSLEVQMQEDEQNITGVKSNIDRELIASQLKELKGIGDAGANKLIDAGYLTMLAIASAPIGDFIDRTGFAKSAAEKIISNARTLAQIGNLENCEEMLILEKESPKLTTGSEEFNNLIGGGYSTRLLTEIHSLNGIGKTQCCLTAAVMATRTLLEGGLDGYVVVVDTENTFRASRVAEIALKRGYDVNDTLSKIKHIDATSSSYQIVVMDKIREFAREHPVKLLIIDSVISHFRSEYIGRGALAERQQLLNGYLADLLRFAKNNDAVVLMTNQMSMRPDAMMFVDPAEAVGGNILGHASAVRLLIRRGKAGKRVIKLEKCPFLPNGECVATLNEKGICDD